MTVRERVLAIKLLEKQEKNPEFLRKIGIHVTMNQVESTDMTDIKEEKRNV